MSEIKCVQFQSFRLDYKLPRGQGWKEFDGLQSAMVEFSYYIGAFCLTATVTGLDQQGNATRLCGYSRDADMPEWH